MSALPSKADIRQRNHDVRFGSQADILTLNLQVGFAPESGHCRAMWRLKSASTKQTPNRLGKNQVGRSRAFVRVTVELADDSG
jgi:hypothetical protein